MFEAAEAEHGHAVADGHAAKLLAPVYLAGGRGVDGGHRGEGILDDRLVALGRQGRQADFARLGFLAVGVLLRFPGRGDVSKMVGHRGGRCPERETGAGPVAADPAHAAMLAAAQVDPRQAVAPFAHVTAQVDHGLAVGRLLAGDEQGGAGGRVVRKPAAGVIGRGPGGTAGVVDRNSYRNSRPGWTKPWTR